MALKKIFGTLNVLEAAKQRIRNVFSNGVPVYLSFSSGKDSLCLAHLTYDLIIRGEIDAKQLTVIFIDEEGLYKSMLEAVYRWRKIFLSVGAKFEWYCLQVKQICVIDKLSASENWITWDEREKAKWMREPPPFAIRNHPLVPYAGYCNYQTFCANRTKDGIQMIGLRATESVQRLKSVAFIKELKSKTYPIYDWKTNDVWFYIKEQNLEFPDIYIRLYELGLNKQQLRLCNFFGDSSVTGLRYVAETDPELWERIERRYPNAYLVLLYWDSEMFKRQSRKRQAYEDKTEKQDYKKKLIDLLFINTNKYTIPPDTFRFLNNWRRLVIDFNEYISQRMYKLSYEAILSGDPKLRTFRAVYNEVFSDMATISKKEQRERNEKQNVGTFVNTTMG